MVRDVDHMVQQPTPLPCKHGDSESNYHTVSSYLIGNFLEIFVNTLGSLSTWTLLSLPSACRNEWLKGKHIIKYQNNKKVGTKP